MKYKQIRLPAIVVGVLVAQSALAQNPETPGSLRSLVYSSTAAELFWQRSTDDGSVSGYEIVRNGEVVDTIDAASFYDNSLAANTRYDYAIRAIDNEGNRSDVASTSLTTRDTNGLAVVAAPNNISAIAYSTSAIELFWDRPSTDVLSYEVYQNSESLIVTDGVSLFIDALAAATTYQYDVVAISAEGARSIASSVSVSTLGIQVGEDIASIDTIDNLRVLVYSSTAAELFWQNSVDTTLTTEVSRDSVVIGNTQGNSFYDSTRTDGLSYSYTLTTKDLSDDIVAMASITDDGFIGNQSTAVTEEPTETIIATGTSSSTDGVLCDYVNITFNDSASVNATSSSEWTCSATARELTANGIPDHAAGTFPNAGNPNTIGELEVSASYTLTPTQTDTATTLGGPAGPQGYVLNGVKIDASTAGSCDNSGENCSLVDNSGSWNIEALGQSAFDFGTDENNAHVQPGGSYHYHGMPEGFITLQGGDSSTMTLIAWAADGFPIYARYGYSIADDASSAIRSITGSYQLVADDTGTRPSADTFALGTFAQDWEYVEGAGDLDECNGRVGVTPEFPGGIYHYFATDSYPYFQRCVLGEVEGAGGPGGPGDGPPQ